MFSKLLNSIWGKKEEKLLEDINKLQKIGGELIILRFRTISEQSGGILAPTNNTSDAEILEVYKTVLSAFQQAAEQRGEHIPALNLNYIAFQFIQIYENMGNEFFLDHLEYQIDFYHKNGLRDDYKEELSLF